MARKNPLAGFVDLFLGAAAFSAWTMMEGI